MLPEMVMIPLLVTVRPDIARLVSDPLRTSVPALVFVSAAAPQIAPPEKVYDPPVLLTVTLATVLVPLQESVEETARRGEPAQALLHAGVAVVMVRSHPPAMLPPSPVVKSNTYRLQVPFGFVLLKTDAKVALPAGAGS